jgi:UDP-2-acetamido-2-deoxy-ribo-hexuluronate aminotransferase
MHPITFVDLKTQAEILGKDIRQAMEQVMSHGRFIMGPEVYELEQKLSDFTGAKHVVSCSSGTDALLMALMAIDIGPGDAVFTSPFTFVATAEVISLLGATPVFVDIRNDTFNIDPVKLAKTVEHIDKNLSGKSLTPKCIIPVDIFGLPAEYDVILEIADRFGLVVVEDAAQSLGGRIDDRMAGNLAHMGATSFFPAKPLGCYGDGGAVFTNDDHLQEKLASIRVHGKGQHKYDNVRTGINGRMDTLQAAVLIQKLKIFTDEIDKRRVVAQKYREHLDGKVLCQKVPKSYESACAQFSFLCQNRNRVISRLEKNHIPYGIYYHKPLHLQKAFSGLDYRTGDFPVAEMVSDAILSIPMHPYLSEEQVDFVIHTIVGGLT